MRCDCVLSRRDPPLAYPRSLAGNSIESEAINWLPAIPDRGFFSQVRLTLLKAPKYGENPLFDFVAVFVSVIEISNKLPWIQGQPVYYGT